MWAKRQNGAMSSFLLFAVLQVYDCGAGDGRALVRYSQQQQKGRTR
jgi:hypothetical protein